MSETGPFHVSCCYQDRLLHAVADPVVLSGWRYKDSLIVWEARRLILRITGLATIKVGVWLKDKETWHSLCKAVEPNQYLMPSRKAAAARREDINERHRLEWTMTTAAFLLLSLSCACDRREGRQRMNALFCLAAWLQRALADADLSGHDACLALDPMIASRCAEAQAAGTTCEHLVACHACLVAIRGDPPIEVMARVRAPWE